MPDYAQRVAQALKKIGVNCTVKVYTSAQYFDGVCFGAAGKLAPWLATDFGIVDYGAPAGAAHVPERRVAQGGVWNAARYSNTKFDEAGGPVLRCAEPGRPEEVRRADPGAAPARHAGDLCVLLQLHRRDVQEGARLRARRHGLVNLRKVTIG